MKKLVKTNQTKLSWKALICALALLMSASAHGANLQLKVELPAACSLLFPVRAEISLENVGQEGVIIESFPRPHVLRVDIAKVGKGSLEYQGFANPITGPEESYIPPIALAPGAGAKFGTVVAAKWGTDNEPLAAAFTSTGLFSLRFSYPVSFRENGQLRVEYVRSVPVTVQVTNVPTRHQAALDDLRKMPQVVWLLQPRAAALAGQAELDRFEANLRQHLGKHPDSPWAGLAKHALATRLYEKFVRGSYQPPALRQEITNLLNDARAEGQFYREDTAQLQSRMERIAGEERARTKSKVATTSAKQNVEDRFKELLEHMARGDTNAIMQFLIPNFRYDARLDTSGWLAKLKRDHDATAPFPMSARFKTVSVTGPADETVLIAEVTYESGGRKSVRRVAATYQFARGTWLLAEWKNIGVAKP